ncbi:MAG: membrane associated rhomboid family serine protease [Planctomycetota bacterium]
MKDVLQQADEIPVTLLVTLAYVTLAFLTSPISPTNPQMHQHGWLLATEVSNGEPWRLLTNAFLHGGWMHLGFNTYAMLSFGPGLERSLGSVRMALLYVISALGASFAVCLVNAPWQPVLGGSGALFGMVGAVIALQMRSSRSALGFLDFAGPRRTLKLVGLYLIVGMFVPFISNTGHVGGLITGFGLTFLFMTGTNQLERWMPMWRAAYVAMLCGLLLHVLQPTTRWDWLARQSLATEDRERSNDLAIAAAMSLTGKSKVTAADIRAVQREMDTLDTWLKEWNEK